MNEYKGWVVAVIMALVAIRYIWKYTRLEQHVMDLKARGILKDLNREALKKEVRATIEEEIEDALRGEGLQDVNLDDEDEIQCDYPCYGPPALSPEKLMDKWSKRLGWNKK